MKCLLKVKCTLITRKQSVNETKYDLLECSKVDILSVRETQNIDQLSVKQDTYTYILSESA